MGSCCDFAFALTIFSFVLGLSHLQFVFGDISASSGAHERNEKHITRYYFWNTVTGEVQWDDPGGVPYETPNGLQYWIGKDGQQEYIDKEATQYTWVEGWSEQYERSFFYNQETQESVWDRPPDLAWRRVPVQEEL